MEENLMESLEKSLSEKFDIKGVQKRLKERAKEEAQQAPPAPQAPQAPQWMPIDLYSHNQRKRTVNAKKEFPKGSRAIVKAITESLINGGDGAEGLARAKKRAEDDIEVLKAQGYKDRADIRRNQYMEEHFLPAVEVVIDYTSPDELLNCKEALKALDDKALGVGSMSGYTAAYVRQAYGNQLGQKHGGSDPNVKAEMCRIKQLVGNDQIRTAIGIATKLKKKIDDGEAMAEPEDYAVLGRIVAYAN